MTGGGTLNLNATNTYRGATLIAAGIVYALDNSALGNNSAVTVDSGATVNFSGLVNTGLSGTYYSAAPNNPNSNAFNSLTTLLAYVAGLPVIATDSSSTSNGQNSSGNNFDYGTTGEGFPAAILNNPNQFIGVWTGEFDAQTAGLYTFNTGSDDGSMIFIDGNVVVNNNAYQGVTVRSGTVTLTQGYHNIVIAYYQGGGGYGMYADVQVPGGAMQLLPNALLVNSNSQINFGSLAGGGNILVSSSTLINVTVGSNNSSTVYSGVLSGFTGLTKVGAGTLTLSNTNTYLGPTEINAGTLTAAADGAMGQNNDSGVVVNTGGALAFSGGVNYTTAEPVTVNGSGPAPPLVVPNAYVGFTGATGGAASVQDILNWNYTSGATNINYSTGFAGSNLSLNGGASVLGSGALQLTDGNNNETRTAWTPTTVSAGSFTSTFQWTYGNTVTPVADGFTFALQNSGATAIGSGGGGLGYSGITGTSIAVEFNIYTGSGSGSGSDFGLGLNGAINHPIDLTAYGINFHSNPNDVYQATVTDDGNGNLTVSIWDTTLNPTSNAPNYTQTFAISGSGTGNGAIQNISGSNTYAGPITLAGPATIGSQAGSLTLAGNVNLGQTGNLTVTGAGQTTISGVVSGAAPKAHPSRA